MLHTLLLLAIQQDHVNEHMLPTGMLLAPVGRVVELPGSRPVDVKISPDKTTIFVKDRDSLHVLRASDLLETQKIASPGGASLWGMDVSADGKTVYFTNSETKLHIFSLGDDGRWSLTKSIDLPGPKGKGDSFPCGIRVTPDGSTAYVCLSINNTLGVVDLASGKLTRQIPVGIAPYDVEIRDQMAYVSNQGGRLPKPGDKTADSAGTETPTDDRGVAKTGTVSVVDLAAGKETTEIAVGLQPSDVILLPGRDLGVVANANSDTVTMFGLKSHVAMQTVVVKADKSLPFGSMPNALEQQGDRLFVALAGNNAVAIMDMGRSEIDDDPEGFIPTGWYPAGLASDGHTLFVANNQGVGSRTRDPKQPGWNSHNHRGSIQSVDLSGHPAINSWTAIVRDLAFVPQILKSRERVENSTAKPVPIPAKLGDPSVFQHIVYVIKENRSYDQMFGDIKTGDGDPKLCTFPEINSPNHHALARQFVLLDNYYCNGVLSADGHSWETEGNVTPYLTRAFGGFNRSYTFGNDPITYSSSGFIWDYVLGAGLSFRNYGEMNDSAPVQKLTLPQILAAEKAGKQVDFTTNIGIERLRRYSNLKSPGWNLGIPDQVRMDRFMTEFKEFEKNGRFPNFVLLYLPQDHTGNMSARAHIADNDLAIGRLVDTISHSRFWSTTAIFINEDDPQNGYDHVDGHRSICLVASPYTKRRQTISHFYNQTSVLRTILHIFGLPPMNQRDGSSPLMRECFTDKADLTPYNLVPENFSLDDSDLKKETGKAAMYWEKVKKSFTFEHPDFDSVKDDELLNQVIWHEMKGANTPFPWAYVGPHGKGLAKRGLKKANVVGDGD